MNVIPQVDFAMKNALTQTEATRSGGYVTQLRLNLFGLFPVFKCLALQVRTRI